jgi:hypothetical protein
LAIFAAIRRASSRVNNFAADANHSQQHVCKSDNGNNDGQYRKCGVLNDPVAKHPCLAQLAFRFQHKRNYWLQHRPPPHRRPSASSKGTLTARANGFTFSPANSITPVST